MKSKYISKLLVAVILAAFLAVVLPVNVSADDSCESDEIDSGGGGAENSVQITGFEGTFYVGSQGVEYEDGKPVIRLYSTTWCPHCIWIGDTFDEVVIEYVQAGEIVAYHWELNTKDNTLTATVETEIPQSDWDVFNTYSPDIKVPAFVFGGKYWRIGNGYESLDDLDAEEAEFRTLIEKLIDYEGPTYEKEPFVPVTEIPGVSSSDITHEDISVSEAKDIIDSGENIVIIDIRAYADYEVLHIPDAISMPFTELEQGMDDLERDQTIIVYSKIGGMGQDASAILAQNGFENVNNIDGGFDAWMFAGYETIESDSFEPADGIEDSGLNDDTPEQDATSPVSAEDDQSSGVNAKDTVFYTFVSIIIIEGIIGLFIISGNYRGKAGRGQKNTKVMRKIGAMIAIGVLLGTVFQVLFTDDGLLEPWEKAELEGVVITPVEPSPDDDPDAPQTYLMKYQNGALLTTDKDKALDKDWRMVFIQDRMGNQIGYYRLEDRYDGTYDLFIWFDEPGTHAEIMGISIPPEGLHVKMDTPIDPETQDLITLFASWGLVLGPRDYDKFVSDLFYVDPIESDSNTITLSLNGGVRSILYCPTFDPIDFSCDEWEPARIAFTTEDETVTFEPENLGAYVASGEESPYSDDDWTVEDDKLQDDDLLDTDDPYDPYAFDWLKEFEMPSDIPVDDDTTDEDDDFVSPGPYYDSLFIEDDTLVDPDDYMWAFESAARIDQYSLEQLSAVTKWVVLTEGYIGAISLANRLGVENVEPSHSIENTYYVTLPVKDARRIDDYVNLLNSINGVQTFYPMVPQEYGVHSFVPNDNYYLMGAQWYLDNHGQTLGTPGQDANVNPVWTLGYTGKGVVIAIVDDSLEHNHPDLDDNYRADLSKDYKANVIDNDPSPEGMGDFHGTPVAGIAAAEGGNGDGITGAAPKASIAGIRLISPEDSSILEQRAAMALSHMQDQIHIYSNSWGPTESWVINTPHTTALAEIQAGALLGRPDENGNPLGNIYVFAAGNDADEHGNVNYNGYTNSRYTIAVAAIDHHGVHSAYSNTGAALLISAYSDSGERILYEANMTEDPGWTLDPQWAYGPPTGGGSHNLDPASGFTDFDVIGTNLDGDYPDDLLVTKYATTPEFDCTGHQEVYLRYYQWLGVEHDDDAIVEVYDGTDWEVVTENYGETISNTEWERVVFNISAYAANKAGIKVRWGIGPTTSDTYPGWNIDDVTVFGRNFMTSTDRQDNEGMNTINNDLLEGLFGFGDFFEDLDYTSKFGGTSGATPLVSGVIALMLEANKNLTYRDVQHILVQTAAKNDPGDSNWTQNGASHDINHLYGFGAIDAEAAVLSALEWRTVDPEISEQSELRTLNTPIPDDGTEIKSNATIHENIKVEWIEVAFHATHSYRGDLQVILVSPDGTESVLAEQRLEDDGDDYENWRFTSARHWDESARGNWTLIVKDLNGQGTTGTFNSWRLTVYGTKHYSTPKEMSEKIEDLNLDISGATIIVPGYEPMDDEGDSMLVLADAIRDRAVDYGTNVDAWLLDYDHLYGGFDPTDSQFPEDINLDDEGELVILFDWTMDSRHPSPGWPEAAGDALFAMLFDLGLIWPETGVANQSLHVIGFGLGSVVASEAVERLAYYDIPVEHLTYLDPHDFDQSLGVDGGQRLDKLGMPQDYGAAVWDNVVFADVYYQTQGENGIDISGSLVPKGRPIPGAYNFLLSSDNYLPTAPYANNNIFGDHRYVWEGFYLSTVNGSEPNINQEKGFTKDTPAPDIPIVPDEIGYDFSRIAGFIGPYPESTFYMYPNMTDWAAGEFYKEFDMVYNDGNYYVALRTHNSEDGMDSNEPPDADFWEVVTDIPPEQDHEFSSPRLVDVESGAPYMNGLFDRGLLPNDITNAQWHPLWNPMELINGDIKYLGDQIARWELTIPGWTNHAGKNVEEVEYMDVSYEANSLILSPVHSSVTHNWFYIPMQAGKLFLDMKVTGVGSDDVLRVRLDDDPLDDEDGVLGEVPLNLLTADFEQHSFTIPDSVKNTVKTLILEIGDSEGSSVSASVLVNNILMSGYMYEVNAGDINLIDLGDIAGGSSFAITETPGPSPGEYLTDAGKIITAEAMDVTEGAFINTGRFYFIPTFDSTGLQREFTDTRAVIGFQVDYGLGDGIESKEARVNVLDNFSTEGPNSISMVGSVGDGGNNKQLDIYRVQQRLRYLNFRDMDETALTVDGDELTLLDDIEAIKLFQAAVYADGNANTSLMTGEILVDDSIHKWLNSPLAPFWAELRSPLRSLSNPGDNFWATGWTLKVIESAVAQRPELMRVGEWEAFGALALTDYDSNPTPLGHFAGMNIDWELEEDELVGPGTGTNPIEFDPFDLYQINITSEEREVILDVMAFHNAEGVQIKSVSLGGTGGAPTYDRIRSVLTHLGVPNVNVADGHDAFISINLLPRQIEEEITSDMQDALQIALDYLYTKVAEALSSQETLQNQLPLVSGSIADYLNLPEVFNIALYEPIVLYFATHSNPSIDNMWKILDSQSVDLYEIYALLTDVDINFIDIDRTASPHVMVLNMTVSALQITSIGDPDVQLSVDDPEAAADHIAVNIQFPFELIVPVSSSPIENVDVKFKPGDISLKTHSVNIRNYDSIFGVASVSVNDDPIVLMGELELRFTELNDNGELTLEDLENPFLNTDIEATSIYSELDGTLEIEMSLCDWITGGDTPWVKFNSDNIFDGTEADVTTSPEFNELLPFKNMTPMDILGMLDQLAMAFRSIADILDPITEFPFIGDAVSTLVDLGIFIDEMVEDLVGETELLFSTFSSLKERILETTGFVHDAISFACDPVLGEVLLELAIAREFLTYIPLDFNHELGPLSVGTGLDAALVTTIGLDVALGFDLSQSQEISESDYLNTLLTELNAGAGVETIIGDDLEITLHNGTSYLGSVP
jgi:subtilisin-like proprotein convertase family protein/rhodanese-related sulfurtransferase